MGMIFWARYPCTVGINISYDSCVCKVLKVLLPRVPGGPRGLVVFFWARYPCTVGIKRSYDNCACKVLKVLCLVF